MNNEIKEILDDLKDIDKTSILKNNDAKILLDYITNLQQELEKRNAYIKYLQDKGTTIKGEVFYGDAREELQDRIEKAVEYIAKLKNFKIKYVMLEEKELYATENDFVKELLDILNGKE